MLTGPDVDLRNRSGRKAEHDLKGRRIMSFPADPKPPHTGEIRLETPRLEDGHAIWRLAREHEKTVDVNSPYFYILWCRDFAKTSVVARSADGVCGYIIGFARPDDPETVFAWQSGVDATLRGRGLARRMIDHIAHSDPRFRYLEGTVTPDNTASENLLRSFARDHDAPLEQVPFLGAELFPDGHEPEALFRIGPYHA
ncbi:diaminobutyrate acetyltransferase [Streptomyces sp. NPDC021096]|uniref:diaminobutyrate acetyltransferase n=1 Tax=Streptomyces sp. NPDC021096 TaxID=3154792 RepID=UPI0033F8F196